VAVGALGGAIRILPGISESDPWVGVSLVTLAMLMAAYAVFEQGLFMSTEVAGRAFSYTMVVGLGVSLFVGLLIALERLTQDVLHIELPIVTGLALVVTIALLGPLTDVMRRLLRGQSPRDRAYDRLLQALGEEVLTAQRPDVSVLPALARLVRIFRLQGAAVLSVDGDLLAQQGTLTQDDPLAMRLPLQHRQHDEGMVLFGAKRNGLPFTAQEAELLALAAGYLAASLSLAERHEQQAAAIESLSAERAAVMSRGTVLSDALARATTASNGLHVFALGPLRVERDGQPVRRWGGEKAGTRQAEAVFAFLFDRGERGVTKDEVLQIIWPDTDLSKADLAFHRTMVGLRGTLDPGRGRKSVIRFHNDRYRLDPAVVAWSDSAEFLARIGSAREAPAGDRIRLLEEARTLYRGEYLDDCPFYGDSSQVEERRSALRERYRDVCLALGEAYEAGDDRLSAAAAFREAASAGGGSSHGGPGLARP
jgi:hypothetical protein